MVIQVQEESKDPVHNDGTKTEGLQIAGENFDNNLVHKEEVETRRGKQLLKDLLKPFSLNWQWECLMREGRVSKVYYRSPPIMKGKCIRRRFRDKVKLKKYLLLTK